MAANRWSRTFEDVRILLVAQDGAGELGMNLQEILKSSLRSDIRLWVESGMDEDAASADSVARTVSRFDPDIIFLVLPTGHLGQPEVAMRGLSLRAAELPVVVVCDGGRPEEMVELLKLGAADFLTPPLEPVHILPRLWRLLEQRRRREPLTQQLKEKLGLRQLVGASSAFVKETEKIPLVAKCDASILISGETGTGKELCARAVHYLSPRAGRPFITVNCGAIPVDLVENELFGHVPGAFTGAHAIHHGLIHEADGGTLFLDEIDCLPLLAQVKLLRFLQEKEYKQLGSAKTRRADVRVAAATNIDLGKAVEERQFRRDLFYRLNIIPLSLPPLRERKEDIPLLANHFLKKYASELNRPVTGFSADAMETLISYDWPGNVRELENVVERTVVLAAGGGDIQGDDVILPRPGGTRRESFKEAKARVVDQFEKRYIQSLLLAHQGNITQAARAADKNRRAFWELIRRHNIDVRGLRFPLS